jgi:hypothetical protein
MDDVNVAQTLNVCRRPIQMEQAIRQMYFTARSEIDRKNCPWDYPYADACPMVSGSRLP